MDKQQVISRYLGNVQRLTRLPFITDAEMQQLFGEEVISILVRISRYERETQLCQNCQKRCCPVAQCELYDPQFESCPIYILRPVVCRLHFCHLFQKDCAVLVQELTDVFFECMQAGEAAGISYAKLFDSPPIVTWAPEFIARTSEMMKKVKDGVVAPEVAVELINTEAQKHRL